MAVTLSSSTVTQLILVDASSGATTVDLKTTGTRCPDVLHVIKKTDSSTYAVTIQDSGGSQIEGGSTLALTNPNDSVVLALDSSANTWRLVSKATAGLGGSGLTGSGTANYITKWTGNGTLGNSIFYDNGTNAGVGTTTPGEALHIASSGNNLLMLQSLIGGGGNTVNLDFQTYSSIGQLYPTTRISAIDDNNYSSHMAFLTKIPGTNANPLSERMRITSNGNVLIGTTTDNNNGRLQVNGAIVASGSITANGTVSDIRLKHDIKPIVSGLEVVNALNPVSFRWNEPEKHLADHDYGFIAQEVEKILPDLVPTLSDGYKSIRERGLLPFVVAAIKEEGKEIEDLKLQIRDLKEQIAALKNKAR